MVASSSSIYGLPARFPTPEDEPPRPISPYGVTKLSTEALLHAYRATFRLPVVALRYFTVYGPRQRPDMGFHGFFEAVRRGTPVTIYGDGEQTRDLVYVEDVAAANVLAAERLLPPLASLDARAFNVGTGVETTVNRLAELLAAAVGRSSDIRRAPARSGEILRSSLDVSKAARELGWRPQVSLAEGLKRTVRWIGEG